jgi:hypothetical protein
VYVIAHISNYNRELVLLAMMQDESNRQYASERLQEMLTLPITIKLGKDFYHPWPVIPQKMCFVLKIEESIFGEIDSPDVENIIVEFCDMKSILALRLVCKQSSQQLNFDYISNSSGLYTDSGASMVEYDPKTGVVTLNPAPHATQTALAGVVEEVSSDI